MSKLLLDTNFLIYTKDVSSMYHDVSLSLFTRPHEFYITSKNLTEYYAVVTKGDRPLLSPVNALDDIREFMNYCIVLYPSPVSSQRLEELILRYGPKGVLIHDFEIAAIALANGITKVVTFNKNDFQMIEEIEIITP